MLSANCASANVKFGTVSATRRAIEIGFIARTYALQHFLYHEARLVGFIARRNEARALGRF
ncbi:MAG: hypothetical protein CTY36_03005, partial [Methylocystis sp.]